MIVTPDADYQRLASESSDLLMEWDSRFVLGRYADAADAVRRAGELRVRMGQSRFEGGDVTAAIEDWLSAAKCFIEARAQHQASTALRLVGRLADEGRFPADRTDLRDDFREREGQASALDDRAQHFLRTYGSCAYNRDLANPAGLSFLFQHEPTLAGWPLFHYMLFRHAMEAGQGQLALRHLGWACRFDPTNANYAAVAGYHLIRSGQPEAAVQAGRAFLSQPSPADAGQVRIMLANALALAADGRAFDLEGAIEVLKPLLADPAAKAAHRLAALALSAEFHAEAGRFDEAADSLRQFDALAGATRDPKLDSAVVRLRQFLPKLAAGAPVPSSPGIGLPEADREALLESAIQLSGLAA